MVTYFAAGPWEHGEWNQSKWALVRTATSPSIEAKSVCTYQYILDAYILMRKQMSGDLLTWRLSPGNINMLFLQRLHVVLGAPIFFRGTHFLHTSEYARVSRSPTYNCISVLLTTNLWRHFTLYYLLKSFYNVFNTVLCNDTTCCEHSLISAVNIYIYKYLLTKVRFVRKVMGSLQHASSRQIFFGGGSSD